MGQASSTLEDEDELTAHVGAVQETNRPISVLRAFHLYLSDPQGPTVPRSGKFGGSHPPKGSNSANSSSADTEGENPSINSDVDVVFAMLCLEG
jgi:hypothetical protein